MPAALADTSLVGYVLADKYQIVREIGRGGMGVVYEAEHLQLGGRVAIKPMLEKYAEDNEAIRRFEREAVAASRIGDPHIIQVIDIGQAPDGRSFVVMELLNGLPLTRILEMTGPMPPWRAIHIMKQVLHAVGAAHAKGIIHRDLKPDNIFLIGNDNEHDFVKLLDFGISKVTDPDEQLAFTKLTSTGVVMGTPLYMAPEQAMGMSIERAADIYACGVILYEMLAGRPPFEGQTYAVLVAKLLTQPPEYLGNLRPGLPLALVNAVHKALEKEPPARFANAEQFAASLPGDRTASQIELAGTLDSGMAIARVSPTTQRRSSSTKRMTWIAVIGALLLGVATAGVLIATQTGASKRTEQVETAPPTNDEPKPEKPVETPTATTGSVQVNASPQGARIVIDGKVVGTTTATVTLEEGKHTVRAELEGFVAREKEIFVRAKMEREVDLELVTAPVAKKQVIRQTQPVVRVGPDNKKPAQQGTEPPSVAKDQPDTKTMPKDPDTAPPPQVKVGRPPANGGSESKPNPYTKSNPY